MEFIDSFLIPAPPDRVWTAMLDPEVMRRVLPGCRRLESTAEHEFEVTLVHPSDGGRSAELVGILELRPGLDLG